MLISCPTTSKLDKTLVQRFKRYLPSKFQPDRIKIDWDIAHLHLYPPLSTILSFFSSDSCTICFKLCKRAPYHIIDSLYKVCADRITGSLAIYHFGISEQTCCFSFFSNLFGPNCPTCSFTMSNSNFPLIDFARNAQSNSSSLSSLL